MHDAEAFVQLRIEALTRGPYAFRRLPNGVLRAKKARKGRNPKTGESADIAAWRVVRFQPGKPFKNAVNRGL